MWLKFSLPGLERHREDQVISFYLSYDKPHGELALGENYIKIISDKSNSQGMFLQIQSDIHVNREFNVLRLFTGAMGRK